MIGDDSLTFGNPLKFSPNSYHNAKSRPTFLQREREHPKLRMKHTAHTMPNFERGPPTGPRAHGSCCHVGGRTKARNIGGGFSAPF